MGAKFNLLNNKIYIILMALLVFLQSCNDYERGFDAGHNKGVQDGYIKGEEEGKKQGYDNGYSDGYGAKHKDINIEDSATKYFNDYSYIVFSYAFYGLFVLACLFTLFYSLFIANKDGKIIFGKILFFIVASGLSYLSMRLINLNNILYFNIKGGLGWLVIFTLLPIAFFISKLIHFLLSSESLSLEIFTIFISTIILFYFGLFSTNLDLFLIQNQFYALCLISITMGGLLYTGYKIINNRLAEMKIERKREREFPNKSNNVNKDNWISNLIKNNDKHEYDELIDSKNKIRKIKNYKDDINRP